MVAPAQGQSGRGTATDLFVPGQDEGNPSEGIYFLDSTPINTVYYALDVILPELSFVPDLVVSGPNEGWNIGLGGISSGTIAAAQGAMSRGNPAIAVSASLFEAENPLAVPRIAEIAARFVDEVVIDDHGELVLEGGQGFNVNIPNVFDIETGQVGAVDDFEFELTKFGLASPLGGPVYFRDLEDCAVQRLLLDGALNGQSGLCVVAPYFDAGYPLDDHPNSEGNAIGEVSTPFFQPIPGFTVTVSPIQFTLEAPPTSAMRNALSSKSGKGAKSSSSGD